MRVLIVEDETAAYENLVDMLSAIDPSITVVGNTEGVQQTVRWLEVNTKPDLIFMDIHLSDGSAFAIFDMIQVETPIIFTTAYDQYAIDAFKVNSVDYLLKPVKQTDLEAALAKLRKFTKSDMEQYLEQMAQLRPARKYRDKLLITYKDKLIPVNTTDISCFYTTDKITQVVMRDGTTYPYAKTLEQIITALDPSLFMRANKQYVLSRNCIREITVWFDSRLRVSIDVEVPEQIFISKNKAAEFKAWIVNEDIE